MKKFLINISLFLFSLLLLGVAAHYLTYEETTLNQNDFTAAIIDKHQRAAEIGSPKIIIAGGSNMAFNVDSERMQKELGLPVVNTALSVGLGLDFMVHEVIDLANPGDQVYLSTTFFGEVDALYGLKKHTKKFYPRAGNYYRFNLSEELTIFSRELRIRLFDTMYALLGRGGNGVSEPIAVSPTEHLYTRDAFNENGDFVAHYGLPQVEELDQRLTFTYSYWEGIETLQYLQRRAEEKGFSVVYLFPAYPLTDYERNREVLERMESDMRNDLSMPILGDLTSFLFEEELFFDTAYHLKREGKVERTERMIELVRRGII